MTPNSHYYEIILQAIPTTVKRGLAKAPPKNSASPNALDTSLPLSELLASYVGDEFGSFEICEKSSIFMPDYRAEEIRLISLDSLDAPTPKESTKNEAKAGDKISNKNNTKADAKVDNKTSAKTSDKIDASPMADTKTDALASHLSINSQDIEKELDKSMQILPDYTGVGKVDFISTAPLFIIRCEEEGAQTKAGLEKALARIARGLASHATCIYTMIRQQNADWIEMYKASIKPICIGDFYIHPSWAKKRADKTSLKIEPSLAFGSGHHPTTSSCIRALEALSKEKDGTKTDAKKSSLSGKTLLDVGCGSGILGLVASSLGASPSLCDIDPLAIEESVKNFEANRARIASIRLGSIDTYRHQSPRCASEGRVSKSRTSEQGLGTIDAPKTFDIVVANITANILLLLRADLCSMAGETLILSGIYDRYITEVLGAFARGFEELATKGEATREEINIEISQEISTQAETSKAQNPFILAALYEASDSGYTLLDEREARERFLSRAALEARGAIENTDEQGALLDPYTEQEVYQSDKNCEDIWLTLVLKRL